MIKSFLVSMFAITLFTLGAAAAWFYFQLEPFNKAESEADTLQAGAVGETIADPVPKPDLFSGGGALPAVVRGPDLDAEEMFRLSTATAAKREELRQYEERLRDHKLRIRAADADTQAAQREVEGTLGQVRNLMDASEKLLTQVTESIKLLQQERDDTARKTDELKKLETETGAGEAANMKTFAELLASMPPDNSAQTIKEMMNNGKSDFAIQLLHYMEPRNASKVLAEIGDAQMVAEIAAGFRTAPVTR